MSQENRHFDAKQMLGLPHAQDLDRNPVWTGVPHPGCSVPHAHVPSTIPGPSSLVSGAGPAHLKESFRIFQIKCFLVWGQGQGRDDGLLEEIIKNLSYSVFGLYQ